MHEVSYKTIPATNTMTNSEAFKKGEEHHGENTPPPRPILALSVVVTGLVLSALVTFVVTRSASASSSLLIRTTKPLADESIVSGWGPLGMRGISHICVNVPNIADAVEFYTRVLGFVVMSAGDLWGDFVFEPLQNEAFCKNAGFMDGICLLDCTWLRHPHLNINLELFRYYHPEGRNLIEEYGQPGTQDIGGIRHISYAVEDVDKAFEFLKTQEGVTLISDHPQYRPITMVPFAFKFFYWVDPFGVQWECEEGDEIVTRQISGVTRNVDGFIEFK